jgi:hypothetical protein
MYGFMMQNKYWLSLTYTQPVSSEDRYQIYTVGDIINFDVGSSTEKYCSCRSRTMLTMDVDKADIQFVDQEIVYPIIRVCSERGEISCDNLPEYNLQGFAKDLCQEGVAPQICLSFL